MKIFIASILCALMGHAVGGFLGWPGATAVRTITPGQTKTTAYSTTQYINTLPASYSYGAQPQFLYQVPQISSFAPLSNGYYSLASPSYIPTTNFIYPAHSSFVPALGAPAITGSNIIPGFPGTPSLSPSPSNPAPPLETQPLGDSDSDVIESADFSRQQKDQQGSPAVSTSSQPKLMSSSQQETQQYTPNNLPNFPTVPQIPQAPTFPSQLPQIPQIPQQPQQTQYHFPSSSQRSQLASFPSIPQIPQNPQYSISSSSLYQSPQMTQPGQASAQAPTLPLYPPYHQQPNFPPNVFPQGQSPSQSTSFSGTTSNDSSLNNDDTITIESA